MTNTGTTTTTTTTTTTDPVEHDTKLLALLTEWAEAAHAKSEAGYRCLSQAASKVYISGTDYTGHIVEGTRPGPRMHRDDLPVGTFYRQAKSFQRGEEGIYLVTDAGRRRATVAQAVEALGADHDLALALDAATEAVESSRSAVADHEVAYDGWNRYFLVTSSAGHVHRSMTCSTCTPTTTYAPVVSLSGKTDAEAVEMLGEALCSVCFPEAPVDGRPSKITAAKARKLIAG